MLDVIGMRLALGVQQRLDNERHALERKRPRLTEEELRARRHRNLQIEAENVASEAAKKDISDPFIYDRTYSHMMNGVHHLSTRSPMSKTKNWRE